MGLEVVNRYYAKQTASGQGRTRAALTTDFRELLEKEKDLDAVYNMTPEHLHGVVAVRAMRKGKHVITHKPMANVLQEVRAVRDTARETGVATHLFCSADQTTTPTIAEWIAARRDWAGSRSA